MSSLAAWMPSPPEAFIKAGSCFNPPTRQPPTPNGDKGLDPTPAARAGAALAGSAPTPTMLQQIVRPSSETCRREKLAYTARPILKEFRRAAFLAANWNVCPLELT